jgi:hypothetical protein
MKREIAIAWAALGAALASGDGAAAKYWLRRLRDLAKQRELSHG